MRILVVLSLASLVACIHVPTARPVPGASGMEAPGSALSQMERFEEYDQRRFTPTVIKTVIVRRTKHGTSVRRRSDRTALAQGGEAYTLAQYLPTLHAEGIAKDIEDPTPYLAKAQLVSGAWSLGGGILGTALLIDTMNKWEDDPDDAAMTSRLSYVVGLYLCGYVGGLVHGAVIAAPGRAIQKRAVNERKGWAKQFNLGVARTLGLGDKSDGIPPGLKTKSIEEKQPSKPSRSSRHK